MDDIDIWKFEFEFIISARREIGNGQIAPPFPRQFALKQNDWENVKKSE
jgi:hypothetical protein